MARPHAATPALKALEAARIAYSLHEYAHDPRAASFGMEAAEALGVPAERVFKTLLATDGSRLLVGVVPVSTSVDLKALASVLGLKRLTMADPATAERATGMVVGGISPVGQKRSLPTVVDRSALLHETVFISGGRRGLDVELAPADLIGLTNALVGAIAAG